MFPARQTRLRLLSRSLLGALCAASLCASAHALKRVHLDTPDSTPFVCTHLETLEAGKTRLYIYSPNSPTPDANYTEVLSERIVSTEDIPDPIPAKPSVNVALEPTPASVPELLARAGAQHNIEVDLIASIIKAESGGNAQAVSRAGARGLMQLMPGTARDLGVEDAFKPEQNIAGGTAYLDYLLNRYDPKGDRAGFDKALAAYNAGTVAVDRCKCSHPYRETAKYVNAVEKEFVRRKNAAKQTTALASVMVR